VVTEIGDGLRRHGFDLIHPFRVDWYDGAVGRHERLPWDAGGESLAVLVGNTRALWPRFTSELAADPSLRRDGNPLDRYVETAFGEGLGALAPPHEIVFAHEPPPRRLPLQRLAVHTGFTPLSPGRLLAHPAYGPWFALRAVVIVDVEGPPGPAPEVGAPCAGCEAPCRAAFEHACEVADARTDPALLRERWRPWLAVRDACPVGREHRYSEEQIRFHYAREWRPGD